MASSLDFTHVFEPARAATIRVDPDSRFTTSAQRVAYLDDVLRRVKQAPGIESAAITDTLPLGRNRTWGAGARGVTYERGKYPLAFVRVVSEGYPSAMGVQLVDGQHHNVDSSEMAFKIAGSMAFKEAYAKADPVLLEPIMELEVTVPDEAVGAVNGDLNSRRGRLNGMEPAGGMTTIRAEVPMSEILTYSQSLTSMTGGRGDYAMHLLRYEQVPAHVAQKIVDETRRSRESANA